MTDTSYLYEYFLAKSTETKEDEKSGEESEEEDEDDEQ